jgi:hypothetical protein
MEWLMASIVPLYISWLAFMESGVLTWGTPQEKTRAESEADIAALTGAAVCLVMAFISYSLYVIAKRCRKSA